MEHDAVRPYDPREEKTSQVARMFDNIAGRYDFLNSFLSAGIHKGWRRKCVALLREQQPKVILDVATGTGDFAIACAALSPKQVIGIDISEGMMAVGRKKLKEKGLCHLISLKQGNAETVAFPDEFFDAIVVGFGVRNFENLDKGLTNLCRMLRRGGTLIVLEFSYPSNPIVRAAYNFYFTRVTPLLGRLFSKDPRAYSYLTESVKAFPHNERFLEVLLRNGFQDPGYQTLTFGVAAIYKAVRPKAN